MHIHLRSGRLLTFLTVLGIAPSFGSVASAATVPVITTPNVVLSLQLESDAGIVAGTGTGVAAWNDQSGNGANSTQSTASLQPTLVPNGSPNGLLPSLHFDGTRPKGAGDALVNTANNLQAAGSGNGMTFFVVYKAGSGNSGEELPFYVGSPGAGGSLRGLYIQDGASSTALPLGFAGWASGDRPNVYQIPADESHIATMSLADGRASISMYDRKTGQGASTFITGAPIAESGLNATGTGYGVGGGEITAGGPNGYGYKGDISAVLVYSGQLNDTDRAAVDDYLYQKYFAVPEPSSLALLGFAGFGLLTRTRRGR